MTLVRIIAGSARGRKIATLAGKQTRPTSDRVKESLFGILQRDLPGATVLDLFAGSGNLTFEALSRGASRAVANDNSRESTSIIVQNAALLGFEDRIDVKQMDYRRCLSSLAANGAQFDLIFLDPPYATDFAICALVEIGKHALLAPDGIAVVERDAQTIWDAEALTPVGLQAADTRRYGSTYLEFIRPVWPETR